MHIASRNIDRSANGAVLKSDYSQTSKRNSSAVTENDGIGHSPPLTDADSQSPVCAKKGNRRCVKLGHLIECEIHRGRYHSRIHECVACAEACAREEKAAKKNHGSCSAEDVKKQQEKNKKSGKVKDAHEKTMKQLRKERREKRTSSSK